MKTNRLAAVQILWGERNSVIMLEKSRTSLRKRFDGCSINTHTHTHTRARITHLVPRRMRFTLQTFISTARTVEFLPRSGAQLENARKGEVDAATLFTKPDPPKFLSIDFSLSLLPLFNRSRFIRVSREPPFFPHTGDLFSIPKTSFCSSSPCDFAS